MPLAKDGGRVSHMIAHGCRVWHAAPCCRHGASRDSLHLFGVGRGTRTMTNICDSAWKWAGLMGALPVSVAAIAFGSVLPAAAQTTQQPPCFFMECGPQNAPNPTPAAPAKIVPIPSGTPRAAAAASRPRAQRETCATASGFTYCASSVLSPQAGNTYGPQNLFDGRLETAWVEGKQGQGAGEWVVVELAAPLEIAAIQLLNGYHKNRDVFVKNSRVKGLKLSLSNGVTKTVELEDRDGIQEIKLPQGQAISWVQLVLQSTYPGSKFADTAISELRLIPAGP